MNLAITGYGVLCPGLPDATAYVRAVLGTSDLALSASPIVEAEVITKRRPPKLRGGDAFTAMTAIAVEEALRSAGWLAAEPSLEAAALVMGTFFGPTETVTSYMKHLQEKGSLGISPLSFVDAHLNMAAGYVASLFELRGAVVAVNGSDPFAVAERLIARGYGPVLVGGTDQLAERTMAAYEDWWAEQDRGRTIELQSSAPSARAPMLREASAFVVLESLQSASRRGGHVRGVIKSHACTEAGPSGMFLGLTNTPTEGEVERLQNQIAAVTLGYDVRGIVSCVPSIRFVEQLEGRALAALYGRQVPVIPLKLITGETFASAGALAIIAALGILSDGEVPAFNRDNEFGLSFQGGHLQSSDSILLNCQCGGVLSSMVVDGGVLT